MIWLIMAVGLALRAYALNAFPLEQDELYTITESIELFNSPYLPGIRARPLYYLIEHPLVLTFAHTPFALRILPLLFGMLGIWLTWKLGNLISGPTTGLIAALLLAISPWHLYVSGMARYWAMVYVLATAGYLLIMIASRSEKTQDYLLALPVLIAGALTHPTFIFPLPGVALALAWQKRNNRWIGWKEAGFVGLWIPFVVFLSLHYVFLKFSGGTSALRNWNGRGVAASLRLIPAIVDWVTPGIFVMALVGAILLLRTDDKVKRRFGVISLLGCSGALAGLLLASRWTDVYADYALAILPLIIVSAGAAAQLVASESLALSPRIIVRTVTLLMAIGALPSAISYMVDGSRFDYRWAYQAVAAQRPGTVVLTWPMVVQQRYAPTLDAHPLLVRPERLDSLLEKDAWAVVSVARYGIVGDDEGKIGPWLAQHCRLIEARQGPRLDYRMYRVELQHCSRRLQ